MTPAYLLVLSVVDIYGNPDPAYHWPWFVKFPLIGLAIRACFWVLNQLPKANTSPREPVPKLAAPLPPTHEDAPMPAEPPTATEILVLKGGQQLGPYTLEEINRQLTAGIIMVSDLAWHEGLIGWVPLATVVGVEPPVPAHGLHPPPPPIYTTGMPAALGGTSSPPSNGILIGGYICAVVSLMFLPPVLGLAGIICGVVAITRQQVNKGVTLLIVSFVCAALGMMIGAATQ